MPVGLGGQIVYPLEIGLEGVSPAREVGSFDQILIVLASDRMPLLFGETFGSLIATLLIVATMAASMSTADSNLHALSALISRDVYGRYFRPRAGSVERVWVGRITIMLATLISLLVVILGSRPESSLAGFVGMIVGLALFAVAFSVQLFPITLDILFFKRGTRTGAIAGLVVGLVVAFLFTSLFPLVAGVDFFLVEIVERARSFLPVHAAAWGLLLNILTFVLVTRIQNAVVDKD